MNIVWFKSKSTVLALSIYHLPPANFHDWDTIPSQIVKYFQKLLLKQQASKIQLPSVMSLATYFNCSESDVLDALNILKLQSYECSLPGLSQPITLEDPLCTAA